MTLAGSSFTPDALRVMHVVFSFDPGGMELGVLKLVNGLNPSRICSSVCSTRPGGRLAPLLAAHVPFFELRRREGNDLRLVWELYRLFRRERPQIVHTHAWGTLLEGLVAARMARVPVVVHGEHGTLQLQPRQRFFQRQAWKQVDRVLSVSSRLAERMAREVGVPRDQIHVIRNGVDIGRFSSPMSKMEARVALGLPAEGHVIGAVGRLVPVKDHVSLVEAAGRLLAEGLRPVVVIAGDGPLRAEIESRAAALGVTGQIKLIGHRQDIERVLAALDVFVLCSRSEGLSNTILEAMAAGLPVVATDVGGSGEMVDDTTGLLVPPASPSELAGALRRMLSDADLRMAMGKAGRARVEREFTLDGAVRRYETLYAELALQRGLPMPASAGNPQFSETPSAHRV